MVDTLTLTATRTNGLDLSLANGDHAGAAFAIELNRVADFASDDTLTFPFNAVAGGANALALNGVPSSTPFYVRARAQVAGAPYTSAIFAATVGVAPAAYAGLSIEKGALIVPADIANLAFAGTGSTAALAGFPVAGLLRDNPQATFQATGTDAPNVFTFLFETSGEPLDVLALLGTMANDEATWAISSAPTSARTYANGYNSGTVAFRCSATIGRRRSYHAVHLMPAAVTDRYWRVVITTPARHFLARNLIVGLKRMSANASQGNAYTGNDQTTSSRTRFGSIDRVPGWPSRTMDFDMAWLSEAEYHTKWADLAGLVGKGKSVLLMPNTKRNVWMNDRIGFGPLNTIKGTTLISNKFQATVEQDSVY